MRLSSTLLSVGSTSEPRLHVQITTEMTGTIGVMMLAARVAQQWRFSTGRGVNALRAGQLPTVGPTARLAGGGAAPTLEPCKSSSSARACRGDGGQSGGAPGRPPPSSPVDDADSLRAHGPFGRPAPPSGGLRPHPLLPLGRHSRMG